METLFHFQSFWGLSDWFTPYQSLIILILGWTYFTQKSNFKGLTKHAPYQSLSNLFETLHEGITRTHTLSIPNRGDSGSLQSIWSLFDRIYPIGTPHEIHTHTLSIPIQSIRNTSRGNHIALFNQKLTHSLWLTRRTHTHTLSIPNQGDFVSFSINLRPLWSILTLSIPNHIHSDWIKGLIHPLVNLSPLGLVLILSIPLIKVTLFLLRKGEESTHSLQQSSSIRNTSRGTHPFSSIKNSSEGFKHNI